MSEFLPCTPKFLPDDLAVEAGETAIRINPANDIPRQGMIRALTSLTGQSAEHILAPLRLALMRSKWWGSGGVHRTVAFMEPTELDLQRKIVSYANLWNKALPDGRRANIEYKLIDTINPQNADVRISRGPGGLWSYLGTDTTHIPRNQQTMNLERFSLSTPDSEFMRVVPHEFWHDAGGPHEHARAAIIALLNPEAVIAEFMQSQGWSRQEVINQILTPLNEADLLAGPTEEISIAAYSFPGRCTWSGQPIIGGSRITVKDYEFAATIYPTIFVPPPPPPVVANFKLYEGSTQMGLANGYPDLASAESAAHALADHDQVGVTIKDVNGQTVEVVQPRAVPIPPPPPITDKVNADIKQLLADFKAGNYYGVIKDLLKLEADFTG